ncbi:MAG: hypothetical protein KAK02_06865, partial [Desulfobulbaceae bacterium]|nr:hypothetical protein [Desulfobulbaceae bacterium]
MIKRMLLLVAVFFLAGCAHQECRFNSFELEPPPVVENDRNASEVYVLRDMTYFSGMNNLWYVAFDNRNLAKLNMGEYTKFQVPAFDSHTVSIKRWDVWWQQFDFLTLFEPGETYYFLVGVGDETQKVSIQKIQQKDAEVWL